MCLTALKRENFINSHRLIIVLGLAQQETGNSFISDNYLIRLKKKPYIVEMIMNHVRTDWTMQNIYIEYRIYIYRYIDTVPITQLIPT